jgi:arylsulfatase A-like enzyme
MRVPAIIRWTGKIPAGVVTNEMLAAVDWLPTLAWMVGASKLVPKDRPIDGVDASAFMLGKRLPSKLVKRGNCRALQIRQEHASEPVQLEFYFLGSSSEDPF